MSREYTDIDNIENYMGIDIESSFTSQITIWIQWMTEYIENETGRVFIADSSNSEKVYEVDLQRSVSVGGDYSSPTDLVVDEFVNTSTATITLTIDGTEVSSKNVLLYPATVEELPKTRVALTSDSGLVFTSDEQNIKVEAKWGYSIAAPGDIEFACIVLVAGMINSSWSSEGEMSSVTMGRYTMSFKDQKQLADFERVQEILKMYAKPTI